MHDHDRSLRRARAAALAALAALASAGCLDLGTGGKGTDVPRDPLEPIVTLHTSLGAISIGLHEQMVPLTVENFLRLVRQGYYNGTQVDRIVKGYDIQMGDPLAHKGDGTAWSGGALGYTIPDEFHPALRHDRAGLVSLATSGPDTGNAPFFITTGPAPGYDDRYSIFGHVVAGMDVVLAIEALPVTGDGTEARPREAVTIQGATLERPQVPPGTARHGVRLQTTTDSKLAAPGQAATFIVLVTNTGNVRDIFSLEAMAPAGWDAQFENPRVALPAGRSWIILLNLTPLPGAAPAGSAAVTVAARSEADPAQTAALPLEVRLGELGPRPQAGDVATGNYTGFLQDGRIFDTTREEVGGNVALVKLSSVFTRTSFEPYAFTVGQGAVTGFASLAQRTAVGESSVARVPWQEGYLDGAARRHPLYHRDIVFELHVQSIQPAAG